MLPKICVISKNASNKSCSILNLNSVQKSQGTRMSTSLQAELRCSNTASNTVGRQQFALVFALALANVEPNANKFFDISSLLRSGSDQKSIFDHDQLIDLQKLIFRSDHRFSILNDRSFHLPMINFPIFFETMKKDQFHGVKDLMARLWGI